MAELIDEHQQPVCGLCGESVEDGIMLHCRNSIWNGKWPGCFGAVHIGCIHRKETSENDEWTCGGCGRLSEYTASLEFTDGVKDFSDLDFKGIPPQPSTIEVPVDVHKVWFTKVANEDEDDFRRQTIDRGRSPSTSAPTSNEEQGRKIFKRLTKRTRTSVQAEADGKQEPLRRRLSSQSQQQPPPVPRLSTVQPQSRQLQGKRSATSVVDATLNKRLKSTFKSIGPPRQRIQKIPKGRVVPENLVPVQDMVTGTTMLKGIRNGSGNLPRNRAGDQQPRTPNGGLSEAGPSATRTRTDPSGPQSRVHTAPPKSIFEGVSTSSKFEAPAKQRAPRPDTNPSLTSFGSVELIVQDSVDNLISQPFPVDDASLPDIVQEPDEPQEDTRLAKALVDTDNRAFKKKERFDICSFLTDSLGETVAQGVINQVRDGWREAPYDEHIWNGRLRLLGNSLWHPNDLIGPVDISTAPVQLPVLGCEVHRIRTLLDPSLPLTFHLQAEKSFPWMEDTTIEDLENQAQLVLNAKVANIRVEINKLSK